MMITEMFFKLGCWIVGSGIAATTVFECTEIVEETGGMVDWLTQNARKAWV